jgi:hypothetical protein
LEEGASGTTVDIRTRSRRHEMRMACILLPHRLLVAMGTRASRIMDTDACHCRKNLSSGC